MKKKVTKKTNAKLTKSDSGKAMLMEISAKIKKEFGQNCDHAIFINLGENTIAVHNGNAEFLYHKHLRFAQEIMNNTLG